MRNCKCRYQVLMAGWLMCCLTALPHFAQAQNIKPVPLPDPQIPGYRFPEAEVTILNWIRESDFGKPSSKTAQQVAADRSEAFGKIALHGWGLWTAVTSETDQQVNGQNLRVFETWNTPEDLTSDGAGALEAPKRPRGRSRPGVLNQLRHATKAKRTQEAPAGAAVPQITGFVKYDPSAVEHIQTQKLLNKQTLDDFLATGADSIPPFASRAVSLKPVFQLITKSHLMGGRYYPLRVWPGPPNPVREYGPDQWPGIVWIDIQGGGTGTGAVDMAAHGNPDGSTRTPETTYPVSKLINFQITQADAAALNADPDSKVKDAAVGDYYILLAMHVTSKEISRWTWQTFWWTPTPEVGTAPSSSEVVAARPAQLRGAPANYAMSVGYAMESPSQPIVGGVNVGESIYVYNPWLEADFGPAVLTNSRPGLSQDQVVSNAYGVQTNCMSCHGNANYNPARLVTAPDYTGDQYIDLSDPRFRGVLKVDFLWSIPQHAK